MADNVTFIETNGTYTAISGSFTNITAGIYYMVFIIEGIESLRSKEIVFKVTENLSSFFPSSFETIWSCCTMALLIISNTLFLSKYFFLISILAVLVEFTIIEQSSKGLTFQVSSYIIFGFLTLVLLYAFTEEIANDDNGYFAKIRKECFRKYTIVQLFGSEKIKIKARKLMKTRRELKAKKSHQEQKSKNESESFICLIFKTALSLFQPFDSSTPDAFFFPQQLLASFIINIYFFTLVAIKLFQTTISIINRYICF